MSAAANAAGYLYAAGRLSKDKRLEAEPIKATERQEIISPTPDRSVSVSKPTSNVKVTYKKRRRV